MKRRVWIAIAVTAFVGWMMACAKASIPEPESQGAKLYVKYCSAQGCHDPIPPQGSSYPYWKNQYARWSGKLRQSGGAAPTAQEDQVILAWLKKYARGAKY